MNAIGRFISENEQRVDDINAVSSSHVETVALLTKGEVDSKKRHVECSMDGMNVFGFQNNATYGQSKDKLTIRTANTVRKLI